MKKLNKILTLLLSFCMTFTLASTVAEASVPYKTYTQNGYGEIVENQAAYNSLTTLISIGGISLAAPADLKITSDQLLYVCDTGSVDVTPKIIVTDLDNNLQRIIGEGDLKKPTGIYVNEKLGLLYVADQQYNGVQEGSVVVYDLKGNYVTQYDKPDSPLYGKTTRYQPSKIAVNDGGTMYIVCQGNTNGIAQISPSEGGTFLGYFGTYGTSTTLYYRLMAMFLSDEALKNVGQANPAAVANVGIDDKGLIYTLTQAAGELPLRKLNVAGVNLLEVEVQPTAPVSVAVGQYENIYVVTQNYVYEYTKEGNLLFLFGGTSSGNYRKGLFEIIAAVDVDARDRLYILDSQGKEIQIFEPTEFTQLVHESLRLYQNGEYLASKEPLQQILVMNSLFDFANQAMGQALYQEENFEGALSYYRLAKDREGYSEAYWEIRNKGLQAGITGFLIAVVVLVIVCQVLKRVQQKHGIFNPIKAASHKVTDKLIWRQCTYGMKYIKHPIDGAYDIKRKGMCSWISILFHMVLLIVINIVYKYFAGFIVKSVKDGYYEVPTDVAIVVVGFLFAAGCTYLICTISDGEGRFREILQGYLFSFTPMILFKPCMWVVSQFITFNEYFVIEFANVFMFAWIVILLFITIMEVNNYSFKQTVKIIILTAFAAFIFIVVIFIMYVLVSQMINFVVSLYGEVVYRIAQ